MEGYPILKYLATRLVLLIPTMLGVSIIVFFIIRMIPGDPAELMVNDYASKEAVERMRHAWGLDQPVPIQYLVFMKHILHGDFGTSTLSGYPVMAEIVVRYPNTLQLATVSMVLAILIGGLAGIISALKPYTIFDNVAMILALLGVSMPAFWFWLMLMLVFAVMLGWLPATGIGTPQHLVLPSLVLGYTAAGIIARQTRSAMLEVMRQDYIVTARAKGLIESIVAYRHALKNALIPVVTIVGLIFGTMLGGSVIVESVFSWPGMGKLLVDSILARDYPMIQAAVMVFATSFALVNLVVDVLYAFLDPRIRYD